MNATQMEPEVERMNLESPAHQPEFTPAPLEERTEEQPRTSDTRWWDFFRVAHA